MVGRAASVICLVYEVLCERVLYGGDVLPPHVAKRFVNYGSNMQYAYTWNADRFI